MYGGQYSAQHLYDAVNVPSSYTSAQQELDSIVPDNRTDADRFFGFFNGANGAMDEKRADMALQLNLANTAHQREVADLKAAGLNPWLSGTGGNGAGVVSAQENVSGAATARSQQFAMTALSLIAMALIRKMPNQNLSKVSSLVRHVR